MTARSRASLRLLAALLLAGLLLLPAGSPSATAQSGAAAYLPKQIELAALFEALGTLAPTELPPPSSAFWQAAARFDFIGTELAVSASTYASPGEAAGAFDQVSQRLQTDNERTDLISGQAEAARHGVDQLLEVRLVYADPGSGRRVSDYARLMRVGAALALVESAGDPGYDDRGQVNPGRSLALARTAELVVGKMLWYPAGSQVRPLAGVEPFAGDWARHGFGFSLAPPDGRGEASWRIYQWCADDPTPPCDSIQNSMIEPGGRATLILHFVDGQTAHGVVVGTTQPRTLAPGPFTLTLLPYGMARLDQFGQQLELCGPDYADLAPESLRETFPCGA